MNVSSIISLNRILFRKAQPKMSNFKIVTLSKNVSNELWYFKWITDDSPFMLHMTSFESRAWLDKNQSTWVWPCVCLWRELQEITGVGVFWRCGLRQYSWIYTDYTHFILPIKWRNSIILELRKLKTPTYK